MGRKHNGPKATWWAAHEPHCRTKFACNKDGCDKVAVSNQRHITVCAKHINDNVSEHEFIKGLDPKQFPAGITQNNARFFLMWGLEAYQVGWDVEEAIEAEFVVDEQGYQLVPDVTSPAIYLMQTLPAERDPTKTLLCFYDSGCNSAGISDRA